MAAFLIIFRWMNWGYPIQRIWIDIYVYLCRWLRGTWIYFEITVMKVSAFALVWFLTWTGWWCNGLLCSTDLHRYSFGNRFPRSIWAIAAQFFYVSSVEDDEGSEKPDLTLDKSQSVSNFFDEMCLTMDVSEAVLWYNPKNLFCDLS